MSGIFVSYRRDDTRHFAGRLVDRLKRDLPEADVFMDIDNLRPGDVFDTVIDGTLGHSAVVLALIGPQWLRCNDATGRRIDQEGDYVRRELAAALRRNVLVIPVLVDGTRMPAREELPPDLQELPRRHAVRIGDERFHSDVVPLVEALRKATTRAQAATAIGLAGPAPPAVQAEAPAAGAPLSGTVPAPSEVQQPRWSRGRVGAAVAAVAVVLAALTFVYRGQDVTVPDLAGKTIDEARALLSRASLGVGKQETTEIESVAEGRVVTQMPAPGSAIRPESRVDLVIAAAPRIAVPDLVGVSVARARDRLSSVGLRVLDVEVREMADNTAPGTVISHAPAKDSRIAKGAGVSLFVSALAVLPDLRGRTDDAARRSLAATGLRVGKVETRPTAKWPAGTVIEQHPAAGEKLSVDARVELIVASAPPLVDLPDLARLPLSKAVQTLEQAGLARGDVKTAGLHTQADVAEPIVRGQTPAAHTMLKAGARVDLVVADPGIRVPVLTQIPIEHARNVLRDAGLAVGKLTEATAAGAAVGQVTAQGEPPGHVVAKGSSIGLTVASAAKTASPTSPDAPRPASAGKVFRDCPDCPEMVVIPAGSFLMGSPESEPGRKADEGPTRRVALVGFAIGRTELTQGQWKAVMANNPSRFLDCGDTCPVEQVSWNDAQEFIRRLNAKTGKKYMLPSEAQWEYAARAGTTTPFHTGRSITTEQANFGADPAKPRTTKVGAFGPNAFGLYDMQGNVWEWVQDCYDADAYGGKAPNDGRPYEVAGCSARVLRGGAAANKAQLLRSANRGSRPAGDATLLIGLRLARALP
jgi:formylglycine-generating enzyme required for sulfatase activity